MSRILASSFGVLALVGGAILAAPPALAQTKSAAPKSPPAPTFTWGRFPPPFNAPPKGSLQTPPANQNAESKKNHPDFLWKPLSRFAR